MPILKSGKKALKQSKRRKVINLRRMKSMKDLTKKVSKFVADKKIDEAKKLLPQAHQAIDKAAKRGVIKKNTAARKKSKLTQFINKAV